MGLPEINRDDVLRIVKARGPIIPNELKRVLKVGDTILLGAILSELATKGLVKVSKTKLGGSPFYYDPAKPACIERLAEHLNEKDKRTHDLLKQEQVLRDDKQEALTRVSLRNIKDYAVPLTVRAPEGETLFWKYYLLPNQEAEQRIKVQLGIDEPEVRKAEPAPVEQEHTVPELQGQEKPAPQERTTNETETHRKETHRKEAQEHTAKPAAQQAATKREKPEVQKRAETQTKLEEPDDEFYHQVKAYLTERNIRILSAGVARKRSELDLIIAMPTPVGRVEYYCKAKRKKRSNDGDLASAKLQGFTRQLPVLYLSTGDVTKKALGMREFKGMVMQRLP